MKHPQLTVFEREGFIWSLSNVPLLERYMSVMDGDPVQEVVVSVIHQYKSTVAPKYSSFRKCKYDIHPSFCYERVGVSMNALFDSVL